MGGQLFHGHVGSDGFEHAFGFDRCAYANGVAQGDFVAAHVVQGLGHGGHLFRSDVALVRAAHDGGNVATHGDAVFAGFFHHRGEALEAFGDGAVDVLFGEGFGRSTEDGHFVGLRCQRPFKPLQVRDEGGVANARLAVDAGHNLGRIAHLWHPFRGHEAGGLDVAQAAVCQAVDQPGFDGGGDHRAGLVLESVPGAHLNQANLFGKGHQPAPSSLISMAISSAPSETWSPSAKKISVTTPSAGALMACSIFMASMITRLWPAVTLSPTLACTATMAPFMGAARLPSPAISSKP